MDLLTFISGLAISTAGIVWLAKVAAKHLLSRDLQKYETQLATDLESHKAQLAQDSANEIERLRAELRNIAMEREVRFSALHEKRVGYLVDFFGALQNAYEEVALLNTGMEHFDVHPPKGFELKELAKAEALFGANRLYLDEDQAERVEKLISGLRSLRLWLGPPYPEGALMSDHDVGKFVKEWNDEQASLKALLLAIEKDFRKILGSSIKAPAESDEKPAEAG